MRQLTYQIIARELVRLRCNWEGKQESFNLIEYISSEDEQTITLKLNGLEEKYSFNGLPHSYFELLSLDDFSKQVLGPILKTKFGPRKPTLQELLADAVNILKQLEYRLGEAR